MTDYANSTVLAIETATSACSVALMHDGKQYDLFEAGNNIHSKELLRMIDWVFSQADIDASSLAAVAVGQGPGSFTGLRIGVGVGQGVAYGAACPMIGVSSLDALAYSLKSRDVVGSVMAGIDARMGEVYWAEYRVGKGQLERISELNVTPPEQIQIERQDNSPLDLVGNAWSKYWDCLDPGLKQHAFLHDKEQYPKAIHLLSLAITPTYSNKAEQAIDFSPIYIRDNVAQKSKKPLPGKRI